MLPKRTFLRRKQCLQETANIVRSTLLFLSGLGAPQFRLSSIGSLARRHVQEITAACCSARAGRVTDDIYKQQMVTKAQQVCASLIASAIPGCAMQQLTAYHIRLTASPPRPFPAPMIGQVEAEDSDPDSDMFCSVQDLS
jgi:hypothetical protein